ncbi:hypothetical protein [Pseudomonas schmalbachii]|uniref:Nucleoside 2-deoxyribosyltransferase n=1 Tax=Pseudomonas schmalbachii TaxID=2816993 RepID=A0ABS3TSX7_9PSED|nr:hypothetical protein [Pseudomonas schmalbachii]MBO3276458.1 hypothetical protein [Pseudomonas schmalbachii]
MFNLLVMAGGWNGRRDNVPLGRIYITSEQEQEFQDGTRPNFERLKRLPALFAEETYRDGAGQFARIGEITNVRVQGHNAIIEYRYDPDVPPIPHADLLALAPALGIDLPRRGFGPFEHSHWAIKDADLFRALMTEWRRPSRQPSVFQLDSPQSVNPDLLSAMMPFAGFDAVWGAIQRAATANGMRSDRADNRWDHPAIIQDVVALIDQAAIVVCDCTGKNPNVFYEMGIAHTLGKEVVIITQSAADIPFDIAHLRHIRYHDNEQGTQQLEAELSARLRTLRDQG